MASVTIRNINDDVKRKLQVRAARNGRSMEHDLRVALEKLADESPAPPRSEAEAKRVFEALMALGQPPLEPFDQKAVSDELNDFVS
jgi:plasmid stability protein